jgi:hypothetical protein
MDFTLVESKKKFNLKLKNDKSIIEQSTSKPQFNNKMNTLSNTQETTHEKKILTQEEMMEVLISKIKLLDNIDIKTKEINKEKGQFFAINVRVDLSKIGNGVFHSAKLNTVSHINRVVNMKLVFSDNENLHHDMRINIDAIIQCFREVAPDTITSIHIETFKDQIENEHLSLIISTIKGSSLTYVYKRMMEFVSVINEKYGVLPSPTYKQVSINEIADEMITENNEVIPTTKENTIDETITKSIVEKTIVPELIVKQEVKKDIIEPEVKKEVKKEVIQEVKDNKTIINNSILNVIENLEKEEKRLLLELENVRKLIKSQTSIFEISNSHNIIIEPKQVKTNTNIQTEIVDKTSFAYKVIHG